MNIKLRQQVERRIAGAFVREAIKQGYSMTVNNGGDTDEIEPSNTERAILDAMFATDDEHLIVIKDGKRIGWVRFIYGNGGWDVISDYTTNLEHLMGPATALAAKLEETVCD